MEQIYTVQRVFELQGKRAYTINKHEKNKDFILVRKIFFQQKRLIIEFLDKKVYSFCPCAFGYAYNKPVSFMNSKESKLTKASGNKPIITSIVFDH